MDAHKLTIINSYEGKIIKLEKDIEIMKLNQSEIHTPKEGMGGRNDYFHESLKEQIEETTKYKRELSTKVEELFNVKS